MERSVSIMIMSGVEDGLLLRFNSDADGLFRGEQWTLSIGRREENEICLRYDTYVSRKHARLHWRDKGWWLEDCKSTNGTFLEDDDDFFEDISVVGMVSVQTGQLFRVGRTWLRIQVDTP